MMNKRIVVLIMVLSFPFMLRLKGENTDRVDDSTEQAIIKMNDVTSRIELLLAATRRYKDLNPDKALEYAKRALAIADSSEHSFLRLRAMIETGTIEAIKTRFTPALDMALKAKELAIKLEDKKSLGNALIIIAMIKTFQGIYSESYESLFEALRQFELINYWEGVVRATNGIGNICYAERNYTKAFIYYSGALKLAREMHDTIQIANVLNNVGLVLVEKGQVQEAIICYNEAIAIHNKLGLKIRVAINYINLASAYLKLNRFNDFLTNYNYAIAIYSSYDDHKDLALCHLVFSQYSGMVKDPANQLKYTMMAYSDGMRYALRDVVYQTADELHHFYFQNGTIDSAYKYAIIANNEKDSINSEHASTRLALLEMEYNYDKKVKEEHLKQQRKDFINIILIILAISALITSILALSRQIVKTKNIRLEKKRLSEEVEYKNKELAINVMNLIKKNEFLVDHTNRLIEIQQKTTESQTKSDILQLINILQRGSGDEIWDEFELRFKQVHGGFYQSLLSKYQDLSSNELKLSALLRLNLTTKEICELTGQRPASLDVARSRLRKKLGLRSSQISLVSFLSQI